MDTDPNQAKSLDPHPNSLYLDPQHCFEVSKIHLYCIKLNQNINRFTNFFFFSENV